MRLSSTGASASRPLAMTFSAARKVAFAATIAIPFVIGALCCAQTAIGLTPPPSQSESAASELAPGSAQLITPEDLVKILQSATAVKPLILNVGPHLIYLQAHIPGAEYIGPGSESRSIEQLRTRVKSLPRDQFIVLYCGCCPWNHCPNVRPAYNELHTMGFTKVKVLYIADNFGADWVYKGYPSVKEH
jgi:thiosulfate/3-mercaptopyruvate sulfurtransferase